MAAPILELRDVNKSFGPIDVLHDISLEVQRGRGPLPAGRQRRRQVDADQDPVGRPPADVAARSMMDGKPVSFATPREAADMGIATVHQFGGTFPLMSHRPLVLRRASSRPRAGGRSRSTTARRANEIAVKAVQRLRHHPHRRRRPAGRRPVGRRASVAGHRPRRPFRRPRADPGRADRRAWRQAGHPRPAHRERGEAARARGDLHHPPGHARHGRRRPLRRADPGRRRRRLPQGREDPRGDHRPDGRRRSMAQLEAEIEGYMASHDGHPPPTSPH